MTTYVVCICVVDLMPTIEIFINYQNDLTCTFFLQIFIDNGLLSAHFRTWNQFFHFLYISYGKDPPEFLI